MFLALAEFCRAWAGPFAVYTDNRKAKAVNVTNNTGTVSTIPTLKW